MQLYWWPERLCTPTLLSVCSTYPMCTWVSVGVSVCVDACVVVWVCIEVNTNGRLLG